MNNESIVKPMLTEKKALQDGIYFVGIDVRMCVLSKGQQHYVDEAGGNGPASSLLKPEMKGKRASGMYWRYLCRDTLWYGGRGQYELRR